MTEVRLVVSEAHRKGLSPLISPFGFARLVDNENKSSNVGQPSPVAALHPLPREGKFVNNLRIKLGNNFGDVDNLDILQVQILMSKQNRILCKAIECLYLF